MAESTNWQVIATYGDLTSAELAEGRLESAGIACRLDQRGAVGLFGPGFSGGSVRGVALLVPVAAVAEARFALDLPEEVNGRGHP
jgi:hypothetical protein